MSRIRSFKAQKEEPVKLGSVWEYGHTYHRTGRFYVKAKVRADFWDCVELTRGEDRRYTTDDILNHAFKTTVQPGQSWEDNYQHVRTIVRAVVEPRGNFWEVAKSESIGRSTTEVSDHTIRANWILIEATSPKGPPCPLCGGLGYQSFNMFDCTNGSCRNYRRTP